MADEFSSERERNLPKYLKLVAARFDSDANAGIQRFLTKMEAAAPPKSLFHYTDAAGISGILASGSLWLSDIFTLNDPSELTFALQAAVRLIRERASFEELRILSNQLEHFTTVEAAKAIASYFVCSFSGDGDDLGQWRAYADSGRGYAIEFDTAKIEAAYTKIGDTPIANNSTFPVTYSAETLEEVVGSIITLLAEKVAFVRKVMPATKEAYSAYMSELLLFTALHLYRTSLFFKHAAYRNEGEYRFLGLFGVNSTIQNLESRRRGSEEVRHINFKWRELAPEALLGVRVGPAANQDEAARFVAQCLSETGLTGVPVSVSKIPYRA